MKKNIVNLLKTELENYKKKARHYFIIIIENRKLF